MPGVGGLCWDWLYSRRVAADEVAGSIHKGCVRETDSTVFDPDDVPFRDGDDRVGQAEKAANLADWQVRTAVAQDSSSFERRTGDIVIADAAVEVEGQDLLGGEKRGDPGVPVIAEVEAEADAIPSKTEWGHKVRRRPTGMVLSLRVIILSLTTEVGVSRRGDRAGQPQAQRQGTNQRQQAAGGNGGTLWTSFLTEKQG
ncbi:MAG: hypothetical protein ACLT5P_17825 [Flavonifractor plautii]